MLPDRTDPTLECEMVRLKDHVLEQEVVRKYLDELKSHSIGLVLAGGGGKGAYQGGVLLALFDCGLHEYEAVAGTSVGALNAALAHQLLRTGDRNIVARLWGALAPTKVLNWSLLRTPLGLLMRVGIFLSASVPLLLAHLTTALGSGRLGRSDIWRAMSDRSLVVVALMPIAIVVAVIALAAMLLLGWPLDFTVISNATIAALAVMGLFLKTRDSVGRHLSLASNTPLRRTIVENIDVAALRLHKPSVYCTMTKLSTWWDPFEISEWSNVSDNAELKARAPAYLGLAQARSDEEAMDWLLQTAALPEIFPRKLIRGNYAVDGGLIDNVPIYPVALHRPDRIIVVYLDNKVAQKDDFYIREAARTWWMSEFSARTDLVTRQSANAARQQYIARNGRIDETAKLIPSVPRLLTPEQFLPLVPTKSLGNFFTGTLNFGARKARWLLKLGYIDALLWIVAFAQVSARLHSSLLPPGGQNAAEIPVDNLRP